MPRRIHETPLTGKTKEGDILSEAEEAFCQHYVMNFNRINAVVHAYNVDQAKKGWKITASNIASENLLRPYINRRIRELLDKYHLNNESVDGELSMLLRQNAELNVKAKAIDIYNKLTKRYEDMNKQDIKINIQTYGDNNPAQVQSEGGISVTVSKE